MDAGGALSRDALMDSVSKQILFSVDLHMHVIACLSFPNLISEPAETSLWRAIMKFSETQNTDFLEIFRVFIWGILPFGLICVSDYWKNND